jgi:hypothetical protein
LGKYTLNLARTDAAPDYTLNRLARVGRIVGLTEAPEKDFCGSIQFCTLVTLDPEGLHASDKYIYINS